MNDSLTKETLGRLNSRTLVSFIRGENKTRAAGIVIFIAVAFLISDTMINLVADFIVPQIVSGWGITFFLLICSVSIICQHYILMFVRQKSIETRARDPYIKLFYAIVAVAQYVLIAIILFVMLKIIFTSEYPSIILFTTTAISFLLTISILGLFATKFFSWYRSNRNSVVVLLYGLSFILNAFAISLTATSGLIHQFEKDPIINPLSKVVFPSDTFEPGSFFYNLWQSYQYIDMASFALFLAATAVLLHHYSRRLGKVKFWIVIILPLLYRSSSVVFWSGLYTPSTDAEYFYFYLFSSVNATGGGILFAFAFRTVAKTIRRDSPVNEYMMIAAYGLLLVFISTQPSLSAASYPPYGISTVSFLPLASLMIFLGLYSTAISVSQDNKLRSSIRKVVTQDSNLLSSIGTAQMEQEIQRTVNSMKDVVQVQEKELEEQTGIEANLEEDEMKKYLEEVMQEVGKSKKPPT